VRVVLIEPGTFKTEIFESNKGMAAGTKNPASPYFAATQALEKRRDIRRKPLLALAIERSRPALINIHDVALAQEFADRVIGLKAGRIAFDGPPSRLTPDVLTDIYGAEDWSRTIRRAADEEPSA